MEIQLCLAEPALHQSFSLSILHRRSMGDDHDRRSIMFLAAVLAALLLLISVSLARAAVSVGLVDRPDERKRHVGEIPLTGGIGIYLCLLFSLALPMQGHLPLVLFALGGAVLLMGFIDDKVDLGARLRFGLQLLIALTMVLAGDVRIESIGSILGSEPMLLHGWVSVLFSVICIVGVINAINMIDGLDGLFGDILLGSFAGLAWLATSVGRVGDAHALYTLCALLVAFLWLNSRLAQASKAEQQVHHEQQHDAV